MTDLSSVHSRYRIAGAMLLLGGAVCVALGQRSGVEVTVWMTGLGSVVSLMVLPQWLRSKPEPDRQQDLQDNFEESLIQFLPDGDPTVPVEYGNSLFWRGRTHIWTGDYDSAMKDFTEVNERNPDRADACFWWGFALLKTDSFEPAIAAFDKAINVDPQFRLAVFYRGQAHARIGDYDSAITDLNKATRINQHDALIEVAPEEFTVVVHSERGKVHFENGNYDAAIADFTRLIVEPPQLAYAHRERGKSHFEKRDDESAIKDLTEAVRLDPTDGDAHFWTGRSSLRIGEYDAAIEHFTQAIENGKRDFFYCWFGLGSAHLMKNENGLAVKSFTRAIRIDERQADAYQGRGKAHFKNGKVEAAKADFEEAAARRGPEPSARESHPSHGGPSPTGTDARPPLSSDGESQGRAVA